ncbi:MAG TPA: DUF2306 domain-containing protein [Acidimicrobiia bacterium]|jgi:hypothetical protein
MMSTDQRWLRAGAWAATWSLISVVMVFVVIRVTNDVANLSSGVVPPEGEFDRRYALNPVLAYLHIVPGVVYLLGAPAQLTSRIRARNIALHRRIGGIVLPAGVVTAVFAIAVGIVMPFGGLVETSATIAFGLYFLVCLTLAYRAIKVIDVSRHRRWMIRAFAIGVGVGMIRIIVGFGEAFGVGISRSFGLAFWLAFALLTVAAEAWLRLRPAPYP